MKSITMKGKKIRDVVCSGKFLLFLKTHSRNFSDVAVHRTVRSPVRSEKTCLDSCRDGAKFY